MTSEYRVGHDWSDLAAAVNTFTLIHLTSYHLMVVLFAWLFFCYCPGWYNERDFIVLSISGNVSCRIYFLGVKQKGQVYVCFHKYFLPFSSSFSLPLSLPSHSLLPFWYPLPYPLFLIDQKDFPIFYGMRTHIISSVFSLLRFLRLV